MILKFFDEKRNYRNDHFQRNCENHIIYVDIKAEFGKIQGSTQAIIVVIFPQK